MVSWQFQKEALGQFSPLVCVLLQFVLMSKTCVMKQQQAADEVFKSSLQKVHCPRKKSIAVSLPSAPAKRNELRLSAAEMMHKRKQKAKTLFGLSTAFVFLSNPSICA